MDLTLLFTTRGTEWYELGDRPTDIEGMRTMSVPSPAGVYRELTNGSFDAIITGLTGRGHSVSDLCCSKDQAHSARTLGRDMGTSKDIRTQAFAADCTGVVSIRGCNRCVRSPRCPFR